jgi:hypothetical protein
LVSKFDLRSWVVITLMSVWLLLNVFDLMVTYEGLGGAYEANRLLSGVLGRPWLAVSVKMVLAYLVLKCVERIERRTPYSGLAPLLAANTYLSWACLHNLHVVNRTQDWSHFLRYFPLAGLPR